MSKIAIRFKASPTHGMGHMVRQLHLGKAMREAGHSITYFIDDYKPSTEALTGFEFRVIQSGEIFLNQWNSVDLAIIDQKENSAEYILALRPYARKIVDFEDLGEGRQLVDLLVDCNLEEAESTNIRPNVKTLFGLPYTILHPDFETYNKNPRNFPPSIRSIVVTLGGTDPKNLTAPLTKFLLEKNTSLAITVLTGPGFRDWQALEKLQFTWSQLQIRHNISNMAETLVAHDAVFCSGGITLHEAMATGTPAIVLNQVPHQEKKARYFENIGAAVNLGLADNWDSQLAVKALALTQEKLESMSQIGRRLIDGRGIHRVLAELQILLNDKTTT